MAGAREGKLTFTMRLCIWCFTRPGLGFLFDWLLEIKGRDWNEQFHE
jgi:hypothetical protein